MHRVRSPADDIAGCSTRLPFFPFHRYHTATSYCLFYCVKLVRCATEKGPSTTPVASVSAPPARQGSVGWSRTEVPSITAILAADAHSSDTYINKSSTAENKTTTPRTGTGGGGGDRRSMSGSTMRHTYWMWTMDVDVDVDDGPANVRWMNAVQ